MKIRQALKLYGKSKHTILKIRNMDDCGFVFDGNNISFEQRYICKSMRYTTYTTNSKGEKFKYYRYFRKVYNRNAYTRVVRYLKKNKKLRFININKFRDTCDFEAIIKSDIKYLNNLPQENKRYFVYDDGKIRPSRESSVYITDVVPYYYANKELCDTFKEDSKRYYWTFGDKTDYIIVAVNNDKERILFARMIDGGWFSIGNQWRDGTGQLDTTGELYEIAHKCDKEEQSLWEQK